MDDEKKPKRRQLNAYVDAECFDFIELTGMAQDVPVSPGAVAAKWLQDRWRQELFKLAQENADKERRSAGDRRIRNFPPQKKSDNQS